MIKDTFIGLPDHLIGKILWVKRNYRTNSLSHVPGGTDVIVEYLDNTVLGYDWIKMPSKYIEKFWNQYFEEIYSDFEEWSENEKNDEIKQKIKSVFARKKEDSENEIDPFREVWNYETSTITPWEALEIYDSNYEEKNENSSGELLDYKTWSKLPETKKKELWKFSIVAIHDFELNKCLKFFSKAGKEIMRYDHKGWLNISDEVKSTVKANPELKNKLIVVERKHLNKPSGQNNDEVLFELTTLEDLELANLQIFKEFLEKKKK